MPLVLLRYIHPCWIGETEEVFRDLLSDAPVQKPAMEVSREASLHQPEDSRKRGALQNERQRERCLKSSLSKGLSSHEKF